MKKLLLGLGSVMAIGAPVIAVVACSDDTINVEYSQMSNALKTAKANATVTNENENTDEFFSEVTIALPTEYGLSTPEFLNGLESQLRTHFGQNATNDSPTAPFGITLGTYDSDDADTEDDHIELSLQRGTVWDLNNAADMAIIDSVINYIGTLR